MHLKRRPTIQQVIFLIVVVTLMTGQSLVQALSSPTSDSLFVMMGNTSEEKETLTTIQEYYSTVKVVKFRSLEFLVEIQRSIGNIFYIGHGSEKGIQYRNTVVTYEELSQTLGSNNIFLSCYSPTFAMEPTVDAVEAGIFAAAVIASQKKDLPIIPTLIENMIVRQTELSAGKSQGKFLAYIIDSPTTNGGLGVEEVEYWGLVFLTIAILAVIPSILLLVSPAKIDLMMKGVAAFFVLAEMGIFLLNINFVMEGSVDVFSFIINILSFILTALFRLTIVIPQVLNWIEMILAGAAIIASVLSIVSSGGWAVIASATVIVSTMLLHAFAFFRDLDDTNHVVG